MTRGSLIIHSAAECAKDMLNGIQEQFACH